MGLLLHINVNSQPSYQMSCTAHSVLLTLPGSAFSKVPGLSSRFSDSRWEITGLGRYKNCFSGVAAASYEDASLEILRGCCVGMLQGGYTH